MSFHSLSSKFALLVVLMFAVLSFQPFSATLCCSSLLLPFLPPPPFCCLVLYGCLDLLVCLVLFPQLCCQDYLPHLSSLCSPSRLPFAFKCAAAVKCFLE
ncbi:hypothetical protein U1Q18_052777 [Sarracenia purpurea var. burkii]